MYGICGRSHQRMHGTGDARKRAARAVLALVVALAMALMPLKPALAASLAGGYEVVLGPLSSGGSNVVGVYAPNRYDAAALALGYTESEITTWDLTALAKLSNESTGGRFYTFVQLFDNDSPVQFLNAWQTMIELVGGGNLWAAAYTDEERSGALEDLQTILNGGDVGSGGSGSGGEIAETIVITNSDYVGTNDLSKGYVDKNDWSYYPLTASYKINLQTAINKLASFREQYPYTTVFIRANNSLNSSLAPFGYLIYTKNEVNITSNKINASGGYAFVSMDLQPGATTNGVENSYTVSAGNPSYGSSDYSWTISSYFWIYNGSSSTPTPPENNWPEQPTEPTPPELPEPTDPVVNPPVTYQPTGDTTYTYNITNVTEPTDTTDIVSWLQRIFQELKAMHTDFKFYFENLQDGLTEIKESVDNSASQLYSAMYEVRDDLIDSFSDLKAYLYQLFHWLADQFEYESNAYDDSSVLYWLKRIWAKMGEGINTRPVDPTIEPDDTWDWLIRLIDTFLINVASTANDLVTSLADLASEVMHMFPFSVPWDIGAFLTAFAAQPVTPKFTISIPAMDGWWPQTDYEVDLAPYDTAAATVRTMTKIMFAGFLAWKSKELIDFLDVSSWE